MTVSDTFGLLAGLTALVAYGFYFKQVIRGESTPNPSSWAIWFIVGVLNTSTYFAVVHDNFWQSLIVATVTLCVFVVLCLALQKKSFSKITKIDATSFLLALGIGVFWQLTSNDRVTNLLLQLIYFVSYIPTLVGVAKGRAREPFASWSVAVLAYIFTTVSLILNSPGDWIAYISPVVNGILGNSAVVLLVFMKQKPEPKVGQQQAS